MTIDKIIITRKNNDAISVGSLDVKVHSDKGLNPVEVIGLLEMAKKAVMEGNERQANYWLHKASFEEVSPDNDPENKS